MPLDDLLRSSSGTQVDSATVETRRPPNLSQGVIGKLAFPLVFFAIAVILAVLFTGILRINNGTFVYTLDDPYIHLALSDQIRHGNYGLFPGTHAAPSSSILFPFILAIFAGTVFHPYSPLLLNVLSLFFTLEIIRRFLLRLKLGTDDFAMAAQAIVLFLIVLCFNLIGIVFTGLEHSLHVATVAAIIYGLTLLLDCETMPSWLPVAIVLSPLLRYEGLALDVGVLLVLALRGRIRAALASFAAIIVLLTGFSLFLKSLGLAPLPSSVLVKSGPAAGGIDQGLIGLVKGMLKNFNFMVTQPIGVMMLLVGVVALTACVLQLISPREKWSARRSMAIVLTFLIGGQAAAGRWGWLSRYEDYMLVGTIMICIYLAQDAIRDVLEKSLRERIVLTAALVTGFLTVGAPYYQMTRYVPLSSNNIYEQQLQMHLFVEKFYKGPIAINDLGLSSYHNPYPVLDLGGLGSEKARKLIASQASSREYEDFVAANNVHLVMVYEEWFPDQIPQSWQRIGTMSISRKAVSAGEGEVQFYATDEATAHKVREELANFEKTLPPRVELTIY